MSVDLPCFDKHQSCFVLFAKWGIGCTGTPNPSQPSPQTKGPGDENKPIGLFWDVDEDQINEAQHGFEDNIFGNPVSVCLVFPKGCLSLTGNQTVIRIEVQWVCAEVPKCAYLEGEHPEAAMN